MATTATSLIGTGISAYGQIQQGKAANREAMYQAKVQDNMAISEGYAAIQEAQNAKREADTIRERNIRGMADNIAAAARSGLTITGSVTDTLTDNAIQSEKDAALALYTGEMAGYNRANRASGYRAQATLTRMSGANALRSSRIGAAGTVVSGLSRAAGNVMSYYNK